MKFRRFLLVSALATGTAHAQQSPAPPASSAQGGSGEASSAINTLDAVKVTASRGTIEPGAAIGTIRPEVQLGRMEVQSYGASTVEELLGLIAPMTTSDSGDSTPIVLLNGKRISGMQEIKDIPTEAIRRVDVLPEEEALLYGYPPTQKVVNVVLVPRFNRYTAQLDGSRPSAGGMETGVANLAASSCTTMTVLNLDLKYTANTMLTEDERDIRDRAGDARLRRTGGTPAGSRAVRSLANANHALDGNAVWSKALGDRTSLALITPATSTTAMESAVMPARHCWCRRTTCSRSLRPTRWCTATCRWHCASMPRAGAAVWAAPSTTISTATGIFRWWATGAAAAVAPSPMPAWTEHRSGVAGCGRPGFRSLRLFDRGDVPRNAPNIATRSPMPRTCRCCCMARCWRCRPVMRSSAWAADTDNRIDNVALMGGRRRVADFSRNDANASASIELPLTSRAMTCSAWSAICRSTRMRWSTIFPITGRTCGAGAMACAGRRSRGSAFTGNVDTGKTAPTPAQLANPVIASTGTRVFDYATGKPSASPRSVAATRICWPAASTVSCRHQPTI
jgi:hypothetical protein